MVIAFGILFTVLGLFFITPVGAAVGVRWNKSAEEKRLKDPGMTRPKSVPGVQLMGVLFAAIGIYILVVNL